MDYIRREKTIREVVKTSTKFCRDPELVANIINSITAIPAADVQEVKRGKWVFWTQDRPPLRWFSCDYCGYHSLSKTNFCPNCGARMEADHE